MHAALRKELGAHVTQKGSLVAEDRLRFDFSHPEALTPKQIAAIEADVNAQIRSNAEVSTRLMSPEDAIEAGAMALFGEKYGDEVRVLSMGVSDPEQGMVSYSVELCGGTHVHALGDIALFKIVGESAVSSGVRRIEALTGEAARQWLTHRDEQLRAVAASLKTTPDEAATRVAALVEQSRKLERELADAKKALALAGSSGGSAATSQSVQIGDVTYIFDIISGLDPKELKPLADQRRANADRTVITLIAVSPSANTVVQASTLDVAHRFDSTSLVRVATEAMGGKGGGGRPDMAQGGGPGGEDKANQAIAAVRAVIAAG
jgi:alanyl-tRNA synthetase